MELNLKLLILVSIFVGQLAAQQNIVKIDQGKEEDISAIIQFDESYVIAYNRGDSTNNENPIFNESYIALLDSSFQIVGQLKLNNDFIFHVDAINKSIYTFGSSINQSSYVRGIIVYKLNEQLLVQDSFKLERDSSNIVPCHNFAVHPVSKNLFIPYTYLDSILHIPVSHVLELDTNLNFVRDIVYDTTSLYSNSCSFDLENNLLVFNFSINYRFLPRREKNVVFRLDNSLKVNGLFNPRSNDYSSHLDDTLKIDDETSMHVLKNGNILVSGSISNPIVYQPSILMSNYDYGFALFDSSYSLLKFQVLGEADRPDFVAFDNNAVNDKYFYLVGANRWAPTDYYKTTQNFIRVNKYDLQGKLIFENTFSFNGYSRINSVSITEDGGLLMAGGDYKAGKKAGSGLNGLVVKLDSLGNLASIHENNLRAAEHKLLVYPNPATSTITFEKLNFFETSKLKIYDVNGSQLKMLSFTNNLIRISVSDLEPGMYFYQSLQDNGEMIRGKFIVEH